MEYPIVIEKASRRCGIACAWITAFLGLFFVIGWQIDLYFLFSASPIGPLITYPDSLCLLFAGLSYLSIVYIHRFALHRWLAFPIVLFSLIPVFENWYHRHSEISLFLNRMVIHSSPEELPLSLISVISFALIFIILICWPGPKRAIGPSFFSTSCSATAVLTGIGTIFIGWFHQSHNDLNFVHPYLVRIGGQIILATGLLSWNCYWNSIQKIRISKWLLISVAGLVSIFFLLVVHMLFHIEQIAQWNVIVKKGIIKQLLINQLISVFFVIISMGVATAGFVVYILRLFREKTEYRNDSARLFRTFDVIVKTLHGAASIDSAAEKLLKILHEIHGWQLLLYWEWHERKKVLQRKCYAAVSGCRFPHFEEDSLHVAASEEALFSQVVEKKQLLFFKNVSHGAFSRALAAKQDAIKGAIVLPVFKEQQIVGLLEFFKTEELAEPDGQLLQFMKNIETEFSLFIERREVVNLRKELNSIINLSIFAIYTLDKDLNFIEWNESAEKMFGWKKNEIVGCRVTKLYPPNHQRDIEFLQQIVAKKTIEPVERQRVRKDKTVIWIRIVYLPSSANLDELIVISQDITKEKEFLLALQKSEEKFRSFVETTSLWIWEIDLSGKWIFSNLTVNKIIGFHPDEILGEEVLEITENREEIKARITDCIQNKKGWEKLIWIVKQKNGATRWLESAGTPIFNENKELTGFMGAASDITDRILIDRSKNEFISMVSHELRTPLASIVGALGLLKAKEGMPSEMKELFFIAERNSKRLVRIVNDILDIEKIQLGEMKLQLKPVVLVKAIQEAMSLSELLTQENKIRLIEGAMLASVQINADYDRLVQVVLNLLSNAVKFSSSGGEVVIWMEKHEGRVRVSVKDRGGGIPLEMQSRIFEKFTQAEGGDSRLKGTGLGLNISKSIVEQMKGAIDFISTPSVGSTFFFEFPITKEE
jgi:PAS domain S-box-containing protein